MKRLSVTKLKLDKLKRGSRNKTIKKFKTDDKFSALAQIRKIAKHNTRANLNDLQRF